MLPAKDQGRAGLGLHKVQLAEPWPLFQEAGCWAVMPEKWGVEDLVTGGAHLSSSTTSTSGSNKGSHCEILVVAATILLVVQQ